MNGTSLSISNILSCVDDVYKNIRDAQLSINRLKETLNCNEIVIDDDEETVIDDEETVIDDEETVIDDEETVIDDAETVIDDDEETVIDDEETVIDDDEETVIDDEETVIDDDAETVIDDDDDSETVIIHEPVLKQIETYQFVCKKLHICNICPFRTIYKHSYKDHMLRHENLRQFKCDHTNCNKSFNISEDLKKHRKKHQSNQ